MGESFHAKSVEKSEPEESLPDDALTGKKAIVALEGSGHEESRKMLDTHKALKEEDGVLRRLANWGEGKVKKGVATLMLGSALVLGAGTLEAVSGQARITHSETKVEGVHSGESAASFVAGLASRATKETVRSAIEFTREGRREVKQSTGPEYAANKQAAIDMTMGFFATQKDKAQAIHDMAQQLNNPALQQGTRDGINEILIKYIRQQ